MEPVKDENVQMKMCSVQLNRLDIDDGFDLPCLPFKLSSSTKKTSKSKKTSSELLQEHLSLAKRVKIDDENNINETIKRLETVEIVSTDDRSSDIPEEKRLVVENDVKILGVKNTLQFFNSRDVTPVQCGYERRCHYSFPVCIFEKEMLGFKRVEFEIILSSFLNAAQESCISDFKSFINFLLRTISVHNDATFIISSYKTIVSLLELHPEASSLRFSSAEIFMLLFNHGIDVDNCKFLSSDVKKKLDVPLYKNKTLTLLPNKWPFNLKIMLKSLIVLVSKGDFKDREVNKIIIFLMWMSTDSSLLKEHLYGTVQDLIQACIESINEEKWNKSQCTITNELLSVESCSEKERWKIVLCLMESIPAKGKRETELRKQLSFSSLKCLCLGQGQDLDENCLGFHVKELQFLIEQILQIETRLLKIACKLIDNCVQHLDATKEEYSELCQCLKQHEASFSAKAQAETCQFLKTYSKLRTFCGQKNLLNDKSSIIKLVNTNPDNKPESNDNNYQSSPSYSKMNENNKKTFAPVLSEDSQSCSANQSDYSPSSSENSNDALTKVDPKTGKKIKSSLKMLFRKKRSSRSSSGNSVTDKLASNDSKSGYEDHSVQSLEEFECHLLNDDSSAKKKDIDLPIPGTSIASSSFSVEYPEKIEVPIKMETQEYYKQMPISSEEKNTVNSENLENASLFLSENDNESHLFFGQQVQESNTRSAIVQDIIDLSNSEQNIVISDFSVEYPEETSYCIKMETDQFSVSSVEKNDIVNNKNAGNKLLSTAENCVNQDLFTDDQSPLLKICEVKSIAPNNMDISDQTSIFTSDVHCESTNITNTSLKADQISNSLALTVDNVAQSIYAIPVQCIEPEIISYEECISDAPFMPDTNLCSISVVGKSEQEKNCNLEKNISLPVQENIDIVTLKPSNSLNHNDNLLDIEEEVVILKETISPEKLSEKKENILPAPVQKYSEILPEISITPVKNVPPSPIPCKDNSANNDEIVIIDEKTPPKAYPGVIFFNKVSSPPQIKASLSSEKKFQNNIESESNKIQVNSEAPTELHIVPQVIKNSKSCFKSQENSSDNDDIIIIDVVKQNVKAATSAETKSSKNIDKDIISCSNNKDTASLKNESLQCQEALNSILKHIDIKNPQCDEALNSMLESIDMPVKEHEDGNNIVLNSSVLDFNNRHLSAGLIKGSVSLLESGSDSTIGLSTRTNALENENSYFKTIVDNIRKFTKEESNENTIDVSNINDSPNVESDDKEVSGKGSSKTVLNDLIDKICANDKNKTTELCLTSSSVSPTNDLQDANSVISNIDNELLKSAESNLNVAENENIIDIHDYAKALVKSPVAVNKVILESNIAKQTRALETSASRNMITDSSASSASKSSDSNNINNESVNQVVNMLTITVSVSNDAHCSTSPINVSDESVFQINDKNERVSVINTQHFKGSCKNNILSVSNENKILPGPATKIVLDKLFQSHGARKTFPKRKRTGESVKRVAKKSCENRHGVVDFSSKASKGMVLHAKSTFSYTSPSSNIQRKRRWSENKGDTTPNKQRKFHRKFSPVKSPLSAKYTNHKSPRKFFDYAHMKEKYKCFGRRSILSKEGLALTRVLREKMSNSLYNQENSALDSDDSDIVQLYVDPKRYADKDCIVTFESEDIVIVDSD